MGLYNADGKQQVTIVDGTTWTGKHAPDGSYYGVLSAGGTFIGSEHRCGALNVTSTTSTTVTYAPDGSLYAINNAGVYTLPW